jgi:3-oxoacyl-[acyl-carrier-protein] synthase-3
MKNKWAAIKAITYHLPSQKLTNEQLAQEFQEWGIEKIYDKTGIAERRVADINECASDLGVLAAEKLFNTNVCTKDKIDFLIFCTQTPDYFLPTSACLIQDRLGLSTSCGAIDINLGCSGYVYGLALAKGLIETDLSNNILLITADTYTKLIHPEDKSVRTLFGDGAAATLISGDGEIESIGPFVFGTDGRGVDKLIVPAGGFRLPLSSETAVEIQDASGNVRSAQNLYMDGPEIFNFSLREVPKAVNQLLEKSKLTIDDVDYFIFHQANKFMLEKLRNKIKIPLDKFCINIETVANTVSTSIPLAMSLDYENNLIKKGSKIMLVGFGVGFSWGACMIQVN